MKERIIISDTFTGAVKEFFRIMLVYTTKKRVKEFFGLTQYQLDSALKTDKIDGHLYIIVKNALKTKDVFVSNVNDQFKIVYDSTKLFDRMFPEV